MRDGNATAEDITSNVMSRTAALELALDQGLDLVEVGPHQSPPVVRLMDYGKFKFQQAKKDKQARRASRATGQLKKVRLTTKIAANDIAQKTKRVLEFLQDGAKVQVFVRFRGRERAHPELAIDVLRKVATGVSEYARLEQKPTMYGRNLSMLLAPRSGNAPTPGEDNVSAETVASSQSNGLEEPTETSAPALEEPAREPSAQTV